MAFLAPWQSTTEPSYLAFQFQILEATYSILLVASSLHSTEGIEAAVTSEVVNLHVQMCIFRRTYKTQLPLEMSSYLGNIYIELS